jgi:hypothetical protein
MIPLNFSPSPAVKVHPFCLRPSPLPDYKLLRAVMWVRTRQSTLLRDLYISHRKRTGCFPDSPLPNEAAKGAGIVRLLRFWLRMLTLCRQGSRIFRLLLALSRVLTSLVFVKRVVRLRAFGLTTTEKRQLNPNLQLAPALSSPALLSLDLDYLHAAFCTLYTIGRLR